MKRTLTIGGSFVKGLYNIAVRQGADPKALLAYTQLKLEKLKDPDCRVSLEQYIQLWQISLEQTANSALGLELGADMNYERMGVVGNIAMYSKTIRDSADIIARFGRLLNESEMMNIKEEGDWVTMTYQITDPRYFMVSCIERSIASTVTLYRHLFGDRFKIREIRFQHKEPEYKSLYDKILQAPIHFSQPDNAVVVNRGFLDIKNPDAHDYLKSVLTQHAEKLLEKLGTHNRFRDKVQLFIMEELHKGALSIEKISSKMNMSRQTLYRNLKKENTSFHDLHDEIRKNLAEVYLKQPQTFSITEVTFLLGFSEPSAFHHAFKRWTGIGPSDYVKQFVARA